MNSSLKTRLALIMAELNSLLEELPADAPAMPGATARYVTEVRAAELTGYTLDQLRGRRKAGDYEFGLVWSYDEHDKVVYDLAALEDRMWHHPPKKEKPPASRPAAKRSESGSRGKASAAGKVSRSPTRLQA